MSPSCSYKKNETGTVKNRISIVNVEKWTGWNVNAAEKPYYNPGMHY